MYFLNLLTQTISGSAVKFQLQSLWVNMQYSSSEMVVIGYVRIVRLARHYNIRRHPEGKGKITHVELQGYRKVPVTEKPIPLGIRQRITAQRCVVLGTGDPECDHKDGRLDDPRLSDVNQLRLDDFQPLSKAANDAKRQHCVECRETGLRFDAKRLGYQVSQVRGNGLYNGTCMSDVIGMIHMFFNKEVSRN